MNCRLGVLCLLVACGSPAVETGEPATGPIEPTTRDSAGVAIHEHPGSAIERAPVFTIDSTPLAVIGGSTDDDFSRVFHVRMLSDGRVTLYDDNLGGLRFFGSDGAALASHGRKGEGPGEFSFVAGMSLLGGDTLAVNDAGTARVTLVHPDAGVVRHFAVPPMGMFVSYGVVGRSASGWYFAPAGFAVNGPPEMATNGIRPDVPVARVSETAGVSGGFDTVTTVLGLELVRHRMVLGGDAREMSVSRQFGPQGFATGLPDGTLLVADNEAWGFRLLDGAGATTAIVRVDHPRRATSPVLLDSLVAVQRRMIGNSPQATPEMIEAYLAAERAKPMVDSLPPFSAIYPTSGDLVWLGEYLAPGDSASRFTAVDRQGRIVGRLAIPVGSRALAFGSDRVVLRRENADGVVHFAVHRIR